MSRNSQSRPSTTSMMVSNSQPRDSYSNARKKEASLSKENYYYHSTSQHNASNNGQSQSKEKSSWMRNQKGRSFYG